MAITMIDEFNVKNTPFEESHLLSKLKKAVICTRLFEDKEETTAIFKNVITFDLAEQSLYNAIKADYELVQEVLKTNSFSKLTGKMGVLIQPRTKGAGHGSQSRAFYARSKFLKTILL